MPAPILTNKKFDLWDNSDAPQQNQAQQPAKKAAQQKPVEQQPETTASKGFDLWDNSDAPQNLKKKDGGQGSGTQSVPIPSNGGSSSEKESNAHTPQPNPFNEIKGSLVDKLAQQYGYNVPRETSTPVNNTDIQNRIGKATQEERAALKEFQRNPNTETFNKISQNIGAGGTMLEDKEGKLVKQKVEEDKKAAISNKFYNADLNEEDINQIVQANPFLRNLQTNTPYIPNSEIANAINNKTKNIASAAREISVNAYNYAFNIKDVNDQLDAAQKNIDAAEAGGGVWVNPNTTGLKPLAEPINGQILVNAGELMKEQKSKIEDLTRRKDFMEHDFTKNVYDPHVDKVAQDIIRQIENEKGKDAEQLDPSWLAAEVDKRVRALKDPILMAKAGLDQNEDKPLYHSFSEASAIRNGGNEDYVVVNDKNGNPHTFKNGENLDIFNKVTGYFNIEKPVNNAAQKEVDKFMLLPENQKFAPLIANQQHINDYFSSTAFKNSEANIKALTDATTVYVNKEWSDRLHNMPEYQKLAAQMDEEVKNGTKTPEQAKAYLDTMVEKDPSFKDINKIRNDKLAAAIRNGDLDRMKFLIKGIGGISPQLTIGTDGQVIVKGTTPEEIKAFKERLGAKYASAVKTSFDKLQQGQTDVANAYTEALASQVGRYTLAGGLGIRAGWNNMMEGFARCYDFKDLRNYYTGVNSDDFFAKSDLVKNASQFQGLSSLVNPAYYAYNAGQSLPYMLPGVVVGVATGGSGTGMVIGGFVTGNLETVQNMWDTYNQIIKKGRNANGIPITDNEAARITANEAASEFVPNIIIPTLEFGALYRGLNPASKMLKTSIGKEVLGAARNLLETGVEEGLQEGVQGYFQQQAQREAQRQPTQDIYDYAQDDDFWQNWWGGFTGGVAFGATGAAKRIANAGQSYKNWQNILAGAKQNYSDFNNSVMRSYAIQQEMEGNGSQYRDGLVLRIANNDFKDDDEKKAHENTLAYSVALHDAVKQLKVAPGNINGIAAAHNMAMADEATANAKKNEGTALGKAYAKKASEHQSNAESILNGDYGSVNYMLNKEGTPIFLNKQDAQALSESGDLNRMVKSGAITETNIKYKDEELPTVQTPENATTATEQQAGVKNNVAAQTETVQPKAQEATIANKDELIQKAVDAVGEMNQMYRGEFVKDPETYLREVAEQLNSSESEAQTTREVFGNTISDIALQLFPNAKVSGEQTNVNEQAKTTFKTSKGSEYTVEDNGTTTRNKAAREEHPGDEGIQPTSEKTYYVSKENLDKLSEIQAEGPYKKVLAETSDGKLGVKYTEGPNAGQFEGRTVVETSANPEVGMHPVEVWKGGQEHHFGNEITEVNQPKIKTTNNETVNQNAETENAKSASTETKNAENQTAQGVLDENNITVGELIDKPIIYKGQKATLVQDGQALVAKINGTNKEYEIGNVNELSGTPISDHGIEQVNSVVSINDNGNYNVRGTEYTARNAANPTKDIVYDDNGNVKAVNVLTKEGQRRTFRGQVAEDLAYQITLKELTKNGTKQLEDFINRDEQSKSEIENGRLTNVAEEQATPNNEQVPAAEGTTEQQPAEQPKEEPAKAESTAKESTVEETPAPEKTIEVKAPEVKVEDQSTDAPQTEEEKQESSEESQKDQEGEQGVGNDEEQAAAQKEVEDWLNNIKDGKKISQTAISLLPRILNNPAILKNITDSFKYYVPNTEKEAFDYSKHLVDFLGPNGVMEYIQKQKDQIPPLYYSSLLAQSANRFAENGDVKGEVNAITLLREHGTLSAQGLQSMKAAYDWLHLTNSVGAQKVYVQSVANDINSSVEQLPEVKKLQEVAEKLRQDLRDAIAKNDELTKDLQNTIKEDSNKKEDKKDKTKKVVKAIKNLKIKTDPNTLYSNPFGVFIGAVNTAIDIVANLVEGGMNIVDAIEKGIEHIKGLEPKFNKEDEFRKYVGENTKIPDAMALSSDKINAEMVNIIDDYLSYDMNIDEAVNKRFFYLGDKTREKVSKRIKSEVKKISDAGLRNVKRDFNIAKNSTLDKAIDNLVGSKGTYTASVIGQAINNIAKANGLKYVTEEDVNKMGDILESAKGLKGFQKAERIERVSNFLEQKDDKFTKAFVTSTMYLKNLLSYSFAIQSVVSNRFQLGVGTVSNTIEDLIKHKKFDVNYFSLLLNRDVRRSSYALASDILTRGGVPVQNQMHLLQNVGQSVPKSRLEEYKIVTNKWYKKVYNVIAQGVGAGANRLASVTDSPITYRLAEANLYQNIKESIRKNNPEMSEKDVQKAAWAARQGTQLSDALKQADAEYANRGIDVTGDYKWWKTTVKGIAKVEKTKTIDRSSTIYRRRVTEIMKEQRNEQYAKELENSLHIASNLLFKENVGDTFQTQTPTYKRITNGIGGLMTSAANGIIGSINNLVKGSNIAETAVNGLALQFAGYVNAGGNIMEKVLESDPRYATLKIAALQLAKQGLTQEEKSNITKRQIQIGVNSLTSIAVMGAAFALSKLLCGENVKVTQASKTEGGSTTGDLVICGHRLPIKYFPIHARMLEVYAKAMNDPKISDEDKNNVFYATWMGLTHLGWDFFETDPGQYESNITKTINTFAGGKPTYNSGEQKSKTISNEQMQNYFQKMLAGYSLNYIPVPSTFVKQSSNYLNDMTNEGTKYFSPTGEINANSMINFMNGFKQQLANQSGYQSVMNTFFNQGKPYLDYRGRVVNKDYAASRDAIDDYMGKYESQVNMFSQTYSPINDKGVERTMTDDEHIDYYTKATQATNDWLNANYNQKTDMYQKYVDKYSESYKEKGIKLKTEDEYFLMKFKKAQGDIKKGIIEEKFGQGASINQ